MAPTPYPIKVYHRWGNFVLWGILADIGIILSSYNKSQRGTTLHQYIMLFLVLNSFISSLAYCYLKPYNYTYDSFSKLTEFKQDHLIYGTALMVLMVLLSIFGYIVKLQLTKFEASKYLILYKKVHTVGGHIVYFIGKYESFLGMYMSYRTQSWFISIWIIYIFMFIVRLVLIYAQPYFQKKKSKLYNELQENQKVNYETLSIDLKDKQWCIFKDQVFLMKDDYIHPGGQLIWKHLKCIEIGQYFYGITSLSGTNILHYHNDLAFAQLQTCFYGQLSNNINFPKNEQNFDWEMKNVQNITKSVKRFDFSHPQIEFEVNLTHITPNHFILKSIQSTKTPTRLYTYIQCMQKPALEYMERIGQLFDKKENTRFTNNFKSTSLSFYIKYYNTPDGMSKYLTQQQPQQLSIQGPYQTVFNQYIEDGQIILICGGTGILPFLDLLNYHLLMTYNQLMNNPNLINVPKNERYITLFYSISSEDEMIGDHIFLRLRELQQYLQNWNFTLILKCRKPIERCDTVKSRFTKDFISKYLKETKRQFYVCGPQILRNSIANEFNEIENEIIYL